MVLPALSAAPPTFPSEVDALSRFRANRDAPKSSPGPPKSDFTALALVAVFGSSASRASTLPSASRALSPPAATSVTICLPFKPMDLKTSSVAFPPWLATRPNSFSASAT